VPKLIRENLLPFGQQGSQEIGSGVKIYVLLGSKR
jgi:hypothetical protein